MCIRLPLAEDWGPIVLLVTLVPLALAVLSVASIVVNRYWGRRRWWGLVLALIPTVGGGLLLIFFLTVRGGAPAIFRLLAALPLLCGLRSLVSWSRPIQRGFDA